MEEIDQLLKQWIPVNTIIRAKIRKAILKEINRREEKAIKRAYELGIEAELDHKLNKTTKR